MGDNLKKNVVGALAWSTVNVFGVQFVQLLLGIILARLLGPEEYGLIGVLFIFIGVSTVLIDGGFGQGLIRKKDATTTDFSTVFFLNFLMAILLYIVLYFAAPLISTFFSLPQLTKISRILFLSVFFFSFYIIQQVQLYKVLNYKSLAIINILSVLFSGVIAIVLALKGFGVWALVYQQLLFHVFKAILFPIFLKWKPTMNFSLNTIISLWRFSVPLLGQTTLNVIFNNIYTVLIGRFYPIKQVGYFTQAYRYSETVNAATHGVLFSVAFPVFSQIQDDAVRLLRVYRRLTTSVSLVIIPLVAFLIVAAEPLIVTLISEKWLLSVRLFQLLIFANLFNPIYIINTNLLNAKGKSRDVLRLEILKKGLILISIFGCFNFGIQALLLGFVVANFIAFGVSMVLIKKSIQHYYRHQILDFAAILGISFVIGAVVIFFNLTDLSYLLKLISQSITFLVLYVISVRIFFPQRFKEVKYALMVKLKHVKL